MNSANEPRPDADVTNKDVDQALEKMDNEALAQSIAIAHDETYVDGAPSKTVWHQASERKLGINDVGKIVVGEDQFGAAVVGKLIRDGFGLVIREMGSQALDVNDVPVERMTVYALLDPRPV